MAQALATTVRRTGKPSADKQDDQAEVVKVWLGEITRAKKDADKWLKLSKKILKRYRDDKTDSLRRQPRYNILYSNTETLRPALYASLPKAVVARRYLDKDPVGRIACRVMQRALQYQIDAGELNDTLEACVKDYLLPGRATLWLRYAPEFETQPLEAGDDDGGKDIDAADPDDAANKEGPAAPESPALEKIKSEMVGVDYVNTVDFLHGRCRTWDECPWVARRIYMSLAEMETRFKNPGLDLKEISLGDEPEGEEEGRTKWKSEGGNEKGDSKKAAIWEIWHKAKRKAIWIAEGYDSQPLDERDDPLGLKDFFPCPRPLTAVTTNDTMIPVPFYQQYKSQADEMDDITGRIDRLIAAAQVKGVYDASVVELARILQEASETDLIPVKNWMYFSQNGGLENSIQFLPIDAFIKAVTELYKARDVVKNDINEISGIADIVRGQGDPTETATGVNKKGQYASLRLKDMRKHVARFARDTIRIMAEIIAGHFQPETLELMSSAKEMDDLMIDLPQGPAPAPMPPQGAAPGAPGPASPMQPGPPPGPVAPPQGLPLAPQRMPFAGPQPAPVAAPMTPAIEQAHIAAVHQGLQHAAAAHAQALQHAQEAHVAALKAAGDQK